LVVLLKISIQMTGCSDSIFDTDLLAEIGLYVDYVNGMPTTMYGIGGKGEVCNQLIEVKGQTPRIADERSDP
jgi:hypothetical protein